jgi:hypothetical protein
MKVIVRDPALPLLISCIMLSLPVTKVKSRVTSTEREELTIKKGPRPFLGRFAFGKATRRSA